MSFLDSLTHLTSNALSLLFSYDNFGNNTASWVPARTERDGFWEAVKKSGGGGFGLKGGVLADSQWWLFSGVGVGPAWSWVVGRRFAGVGLAA